MGKYAATAIAAQGMAKNGGATTILDLVDAYRPPQEKDLNQKLQKVMKILREETKMSYEDVVVLEDFLKERKKMLRRQKEAAAPRRPAAHTPTVNYCQKKIGNRFYWYKQWTEGGRNISKYIKDAEMATEVVENIDKVTITFHPEFKK